MDFSLFFAPVLHLGVFVIDDAIIIGLMIAAAAATAASTAMSYNAQRNAATQAEYNAEYNAKLEEMKAEEEKARRAQQERQERQKSRMQRASIEADFAKSGLLMTGTPSYMLEQQVKVNETNTLEGNRVQKVGFMRAMERAALIRQQGAFEADSLRYGATTSLVSGLGSITMQGASFGAAGGFGSGAPPPGTPPGAGVGVPAGAPAATTTEGMFSNGFAAQTQPYGNSLFTVGQ